MPEDMFSHCAAREVYSDEVTDVRTFPFINTFVF